MALTIAAVAENKKIKLEKAEIQIARQTLENKPSITAVRININLGNGLTPRERKILFNSARTCEVNKMLAGGFKFDYQLIPEDTAHIR